jgi:hypothetical protein
MLDVSSAISGLMNLLDPRLRILAGSHTIKRKVVKTTECYDREITGWEFAIAPSTITEEVFSYDRVIWQPTVGDIVPNLKLSGLVDDATKILDDISLVLSLIKRH